MSRCEEVTRDTWLGKLPTRMVNLFIQELQFNENWKHAAVAFTRHDRRTLMFDMYQINLLQQKGTTAAKEMFSCLLSEGYTLQWFLDDIKKTKLWKLVHYITTVVLKEEVPQPAENEASSDCAIQMAYSIETNAVVELHGATTDDSTDNPTMPTTAVKGEVRPFDYCYLKKITNSFDEVPLFEGGRLLGEGAYGNVFYGEDGDCKLAIKHLHDIDNDEQDFHTEIKTMSQTQHKNILQLHGYSSDGYGKCLVYQYMSNGSLEDCLACKNNRNPLSVSQRLNIAIGLAEGMQYLHSSNLVHRDIKSANVLLDAAFVAKLGDFGIARIYSTSGKEGQTSAQTEVIRGTRVYMARETFESAKYSPKSDIYSFGVILYELLTGLKAFDDARVEKSLTSYVLEECGEDPDGVMPILDKNVSGWTEAVAHSLFTLAQRSLGSSPSLRPQLTEVIDILQHL